MTEINDIKRSALALGACEKVKSIKSIEDAIALLKTPQGREFALKSGFPTLEIWREVDDMNHIELSLLNDVLIDRTFPVRSTNMDIIAVGNTILNAFFDKPDQLYSIIAMHGAEVEINASNYAVVTVTSINATVRITNDGTAKVIVEQSEKGGNQ